MKIGEIHDEIEKYLAHVIKRSKIYQYVIKSLSNSVIRFNISNTKTVKYIKKRTIILIIINITNRLSYFQCFSK